MEQFYSDEKNAQIVVALLKAHNIKKIVASPGTTNIPILQSVQYDPFFEVYSSVDERSAAYIACGLAAESGEPVVLSCTGATASRNYMSGLTEAFYRKLPIIAITSTNGNENIGNLVAQTLDRNSLPNDISKLSVQLPIVEDSKSFWYCNHLVNKALLEANRFGGGPVHINIPTSYYATFTTRELPDVNVVRRLTQNDKFPSIPLKSKICIFIGSHKKISDSEVTAIEQFSESHGAVVLCDHTSNYYGNYKVLGALSCSNTNKLHQKYEELLPDLIIHIGEISGDYATVDFLTKSNAKVWRVSMDGDLKDQFHRLEYVYECLEEKFFLSFDGIGYEKYENYYDSWKKHTDSLRENIPRLPFSNAWIASQLPKLLPKGSVLHFGILNSLRSNNFFEYDDSIQISSNVGGFGIDGCISTLIGASLNNESKLFFSVIGDLAFFYDMNSLGNRHVGSNIRILLINNSGGAEFKNFSHMGSTLGDKADEFVAAAGHYQQKDQNSDNSPAKSWVSSLGFEYISAKSMEEFQQNVKVFMNEKSNRSIVFECFTNFEDESNALKLMTSINKDFTTKGKVNNAVKERISPNMKNKLKKVLGR